MGVACLPEWAQAVEGIGQLSPMGGTGLVAMLQGG